MIVIADPISHVLDYQGNIRAYLSRRVSPSGLDDAVQLTLIRAWKVGDRHDSSKGPMIAWLISLARSVSANLNKSVNRHRRLACY